MTRYLSEKEIELLNKDFDKFMDKVNSGEKLEIKMPKYDPLTIDDLSTIIQKQLDGKL